ncbi:hypothetical protein NPIL_145771 [Nephila pilipes]|uniref:Uncharacterized protein n=1 Tax=Nephila pilipes TaxID=299642 RepID=A0A8X6K3W7_NEPPI|nr:hypothetical protein NPIL_145771 [Nephila pilipes]
MFSTIIALYRSYSKLSFGIFSFEQLTRKRIILLKLLLFIMNSCQRFSNKTRSWKGTFFETTLSAESLLQRHANAPKHERYQRPKDLTTEATFMM